jgi:hypothetical protein
MAYLYGIIIIPSSEQLPEFVGLLDRQQIVESETFMSRAGRQKRALDIVSDASAQRKIG